MNLRHHGSIEPELACDAHRPNPSEGHAATQPENRFPNFPIMF
jgi:hypothetical protein